MTDIIRKTITTTADEQRPRGLTSAACRVEVVLKEGDSGPWSVRLVDIWDPLEPATGWHDVATTADERGRPRWVEISPDGVRRNLRIHDEDAKSATSTTIHYSDPLPKWVAPAVLEIIRGRFDREGVEVAS